MIMSTKKYLTVKEMFAALLDGEKIRSESWGIIEYCFIDDWGDLADECGDKIDIGIIDNVDMIIYKEPKKTEELFLWSHRESIEHYYEIDYRFMTEEMAKNELGNDIVKTNCSITIEV